jgi:PAS domain S-box-containing protein
MDALPMAISWADLNGNIEYNNRKFRELFSYTVEDIPTIAEWRRLAYPDPAYRETIPSLVANLTEAQRQGGEVKPMEVAVTCKDGSTRYVEQMEAFASNRILAIYNDLTEHKRVEEALRESEGKYRTILEDIEQGYFEADLAGNFTFLNDAGCRLLGYTREESIGMNYRQYVNEENAKKFFEAFNRIYRTGEPGRVFDHEHIRKDGTKRQIEMSASLRKDSSGNPIGFRGVTRDITERKQAEEALRQSEERHRTILENMQEVYYEIDLAGNFIFLNEAFYDHLGYTKEEMIGKKSRQYQDEKTARELQQAYIRLYETGEPIRAVEGTWISKDGTKKIREMSASLIRDSEGKPIGFRGVSRDITDR